MPVATLIKTSETAIGFVLKSLRSASHPHELTGLTVERVKDGRVFLDFDAGQQGRVAVLTPEASLWMAAELLGALDAETVTSNPKLVALARHIAKYAELKRNSEPERVD